MNLELGCRFTKPIHHADSRSRCAAPIHQADSLTRFTTIRLLRMKFDIAAGVAARGVSHDGRMNEATAPNASICPKCGGQMSYVRTIWRAFRQRVDIWFCPSCRKTVREFATDTKH
jgi:hypothetical protein